MIYRFATAWDIPEVARMWQKMMNEVNIPGRNADEEQTTKFMFLAINGMAKRQYLCIVAEENKKLVGFVLGRIFYETVGTSKLIGACDYWYVKKPYRLKDVGKTLTDMIYSKAKAAGATMYEFHTRFDPKLVKRYSKNGGMTHNGFVPAEIVFRKEEEDGKQDNRTAGT